MYKNLIKKLLFTLPILFILFVVGLWGWLRMDSGRAYIKQTLEAKISQDLGYEVKIKELEGGLPFSWQIKDVKVIERRVGAPDHLWASIDKAQVIWSVMDLIKARLHFAQIAINEMTLYPRKEETLKNLAKAEKIKNKAQKATLLIPIQVDHLEVKRLNIERSESHLFEKMRLEGHASMGYMGLDAALKVFLIQEEEETDELRLALHGNQDDLFVSLNSSSALIQSLLPWQKLFNIGNFHFKGSLNGPWDSWRQLAQKNSPKAPLVGEFELSDLKSSSQEDNPLIDYLISSPTNIKSKLIFYSWEHLLVPSLSGSNKQMELAGKLELINGNWQNSSIALTLRELQQGILKDSGIRGPLKALTHLSGKAADPVILGKLESSKLEIGSLEFNKLEAQYEISSLLTKVAQVNISSLLFDIPSSLSARVQWDNLPLINIAFSQKLLQNSIEGNLSYDYEKGQGASTFNLALKDLDSLAKTFKLPVEGAVEALCEAKFQKANLSSMLTIESKGMLSQFRYENWKLKKAAFAGSSELSIDPNGNFAFVKDSYEIKSQHTEVPGFGNVKETRLTFDRSQSEKGYQGSYQIKSLGSNWDIKREQPFEAEIEGRWLQNPKLFQTTVTQMEGMFLGKSVKLLGEVELDLFKDQSSSSLAKFSLGTGFLTAEFKNDANGINCELDLDSIPLELFSPFSPTPIKGSLLGKVYLKGKDRSSEGKAYLNFQDLQIESSLAQDLSIKHLPALNGQVEATINAQELNLQANLIGDNHQPILIEAYLPVRFSVSPMHLEVNEYKDLQAKVQYAGALTPIITLVNPNSWHLDGMVDAKLAVSGKWKNPEIDGHLKLSQGAFEHPEVGMRLVNIEAEASAEKGKLTFSKMMAEDPRGGELNASGMIDFQQNQLTKLKFDLNNLTLFDMEMAHAAFTGPLWLTGNADKRSLSGEVNVANLDIEIPETIPSSVPVLLTIIKGATEQESYDNSVLVQESSAPLIPVDLNITIHAPKNVQLKGRGLSSQWAGDLQAKGSLNSPELFGNLSIKNGEFFFGGKHFNIVEGEVKFNGKPETDTLLFLVAELIVDEMTVRAILKGPIHSPQLKLNASPNVNLNEILSRVLFGKDLENISPFQAIQIAEASLDLSGEPGVINFMSHIRRNTKLDQLSIEQHSDEENYGIKVGKYVLKGVLVSFNKSFSDEGSRFSIEADLRRHISLRTEFGYQADSSASLMWRNRY